MKKPIYFLLVAALVIWPLPPVSGQGQSNGNAANNAVAGELLVQFKAGVSAPEKSRALGRANAEKLEDVLPEGKRNDGRGDLVLVRHQPDLPAAAARRALESDPAVEFAEPNWIYTHQATSNDPAYINNQLWGMYGDATSPANQFGSQAGEAWAAGNTGDTGDPLKPVYVGIIDEGAMYNHVDLAANFWTNPGDSTFDGVDNDGNGYIDDVHGFDFDGNDGTTFDGTQDDHGTHVAGTIGAVGGNGIGVAGVSWNVKMISAKFLGRRGGTTANAIKAVDYITNLKTQKGLNIIATNNSWGGGGFSQALQGAIERANNKNILFIAAAGNNSSNNDVTANYPSNYPNANVIAVASITSTGGLSSFSNYGATHVDLGAPGSSIYSTLPGKNGTSTYGSYSGTSMATPHVTGAAALYASSHPGATAAQIKSAILGSVFATPSLNGRCATGGRLNASGF
ncbi:MAG TPA: S8 family peptidase [Blastocatellia bacterium]|nr:S8 family peptidase [Blastocatellia bacterium]